MDSMSSDSEEKLKEDMEDDNENHDILKRQISSHPLYGLLVESHIDCLKVGAIGELETMNESSYMKQKEKMASLGMLKQSELDHFMEAYCLALGKLKEAIEEPQQKSMAFIKSMHSQLTELTRIPHPPDSASSLLITRVLIKGADLVRYLGESKK